MRAHTISGNAELVHEMNQPARYEFGSVDCSVRHCGTRFPTLHAEADAGETVLAGALPDEAALHGVLAQIEALGLVLLELRREPIDRIG